MRRLSPGIDYWLIACESLNDVAAGAVPQCTGWERLTLAAGPACPAEEEPVAQVISGDDYDADDDGLIEIRNIDQLDAIRYDLDGDGASEDDAYAAAFPNAATGMRCPGGGCDGYELVADLDYATAGISVEGWEPIGYWSSNEDHTGFNSVFEGNDHTVSNLYINRGNTDRVGLFGYAGVDSDIKGVGLPFANVIGNSRVGSSVGSNDGAVTSSYADGTVSGSQGSVGGLVGRNGGTITGSHATGTAIGISRSNVSVGGLAGSNSGIMKSSYANVSVISGNSGAFDGKPNAGGLAGHNSGTIEANYATGSVSNPARRSPNAGGLVGCNSGRINASYSTGNVGGSFGSVGGYQDIGGLVGDNSGGTIIASYTTSTFKLGGSNLRVGGLVGVGRGAVTTSYWDTVTSGRSNSTGGEGITTAELQAPTGATGIYASWNPNWWDFGTSEQYPLLKVEGLDVAAQRP